MSISESAPRTLFKFLFAFLLFRRNSESASGGVLALLNTFFRTIWSDDPSPIEDVAYLNELLEEFNLAVVPTTEEPPNQEPNLEAAGLDYSDFD